MTTVIFATVFALNDWVVAVLWLLTCRRRPVAADHLEKVEERETNSKFCAEVSGFVVGEMAQAAIDCSTYSPV